MKILILIMCLGLTIFILASCMMGNSDFKVPDYEPMAHAISGRVAKKISKRFPQAQAIAQGGGMRGCVKLLVLNFYIKGPVYTEEARKILLTSIQYYLDEINSDEKIRKYLVEYPFPLKNIEISFILQMDDEETRKANCLASFSTFSGSLYYKKAGEEGRWYFESEETFEEAQEKLKA